MTDLIIKFFEGSGAKLEPLKQAELLTSNIYYFNYKNYISLNKLNLIIKSFSAFVGADVKASFENKILKLEIIKKQAFKLPFENYIKASPKNQNKIFLGVANTGEPIFEDLNKIKSLLIGGSSGSGKSNLLHQIILSILLNNKNIYLLLIDLKATELTHYNYILRNNNRLLKRVATDTKQALKQIIYFYSIIKHRFKQMKRKGERLSSSAPIVLIIDEYAQLFTTNKEKKIINNYIAKIGAIGRACNCYLFLATQHPTNENLNNTIRANLQSRIALKCANVQQSRNILNNTGADKLANVGAFICHIDGKEAQQLQASFISDELLNRIKQAN